MMGVEKIVLLACLLFAVWTTSSASLRLQQVQVLFRHGARTPTAEELKLLGDSDPSIIEPYGLAELTNVGKMQMYRLGQMLRREYGHLLGTEFKTSDIYARSSDFARTKVSLQLVLAGLLPPTGRFVWNRDLTWMPFPFDTVPNKLDNIFLLVMCPKLNEVRKTYMQEVKQSFERTHKPVLESLNLYTKNIEHDLAQSFMLNSLIHTLKSLDKQVPSWITDDALPGINAAAKEYIESFSATPQLIQLNGGGMAQRMIDNMNLYEDSSAPEPKIVLYSGHEYTVYALARAHSYTLPDLPGFGAAIVLEKLVDDEDDQIYIRMRYSPAEGEPLQTVELHCGETCLFTDYLDVVHPNLPTYDDMLCLARAAKPEDFA